MGIWVEGDDPECYGMNPPPDVFPKMYQKICMEVDHILKNWLGIQRAAISNRKQLSALPYYNDIKWIETFNFEEPEKNWCRRWYRIKNAQGIRGKLSCFSFYQKLHEIKDKHK